MVGDTLAAEKGRTKAMRQHGNKANNISPSAAKSLGEMRCSAQHDMRRVSPARFGSYEAQGRGWMFSSVTDCRLRPPANKISGLN